MGNLRKYVVVLLPFYTNIILFFYTKSSCSLLCPLTFWMKLQLILLCVISYPSSTCYYYDSSNVCFFNSFSLINSQTNKEIQTRYFLLTLPSDLLNNFGFRINSFDLYFCNIYWQQTKCAINKLFNFLQITPVYYSHPYKNCVSFYGII